MKSDAPATSTRIRPLEYIDHYDLTVLIVFRALYAYILLSMAIGLEVVTT